LQWKKLLKSLVKEEYMQSALVAPVELDKEDDLRNSIYEGVFGNIFATLTGGVFLTGFALYLGMNEFMIGLLASLPFLVTVFQWPVSHLIEKNGGRKIFWYWGAAAARLLWLPILIVALLPISPIYLKYGFILLLAFISYACNSVSSVSWLSLMSDLVPDRKRGSFFGTRNMLCGAAGMVSMLSFGKLLDVLNLSPTYGLKFGFSIVFISAVLFGVISLRFLLKVSDSAPSRSQSEHSFFTSVCIPFRERNFRKFVAFAFFWGFSVFFAAPFFTVYFLEDLKFSYSFIAALGTVAGFADLMGMRLWGRISDKVRNKAVIRFSSSIAILLPFFWIFAQPNSKVLPIAINIVGAVFWAGINLCMSNLLLGISPKENRSLYLSAYNILGGIGAATGPIAAGLLLQRVIIPHAASLPLGMVPLHVIFLCSTVLRVISYQLFRFISEPQEVAVGQMIRTIRSIRGLNIVSGFSYLLHPFIEIARRSFRE
jgi:MFS family permease